MDLGLSGKVAMITGASRGLGREMGPESVAAYQQLKSIYLMG